MENIIRIFQFEFETYHSWLLDNVWYRNWATRLIFLHSAVFMPHRFLVPGRQTNVGGRQTRPTVINFPRVNVSTRPHGQRLLFVHQFSIHFRSRRAVHLAIASAGTRAEKANRRLLLLLLREIEREYPQSPGWPLSICGGRVRSYVADSRQTRLPRGSLPSGETLLFRNCSGRILPWISRVKHAIFHREWKEKLRDVFLLFERIWTTFVEIYKFR